MWAPVLRAPPTIIVLTFALLDPLPITLPRSFPAQLKN